MKKLYRKIREYVPLGALIFYALTLLSGIFLFIICISEGFAEFFNYNISAPFRMIMAKLTSWIPFSIAEMLIISIPIWATILVVICVKKNKQGKKSGIRYIAFLTCICCYIFITFVWTASSGYHMPTIDKRMELNSTPVSKEELYETAMWLTENINALAPDIIYDIDNASELQYSYIEMSKKITQGYDNLIEKYPIVRNYRSNVKPIILSEPMMYTHISGVYSYMTGESNINTNYPDFIVASTAAHEMAHQRGISRENEANFVAFLVCINSDDKFLQYSGYMSFYDDVLTALYNASPELYKDAYSALCKEAKGDQAAYGKLFEKYANSTASEVSDKINNAYLQANGQQEGTKSYGMVVDLTVAYYKTLK